MSKKVGNYDSYMWESSVMERLTQGLAQAQNQITFFSRQWLPYEEYLKTKMFSIIKKF